MTPDQYQDIVISARQRALGLDAPVSARLLEALVSYADALRASIQQAERNGRIPSAFRRALLRQADELADLYRARVEQVTATGVRMSANSVAGMVDRATVMYVDRNGPAGYVSPGDLRSAAAYVSRIRRGEVAVASRFRTLLRPHVANMAREVDYVISRGMIEQVDPAVLARRLRGYVTGSDSFKAYMVEQTDAAGNVVGRKIDLRKLPADVRGAARQMRHNAERIAHTEMHVAAHETTTQAMREAPMVEAVEWRLSADRGSGQVPDVCDLLATADYHGLGPGRYPVGAVPPLPHPFDRCRTVPVFREFDQWDSPKPVPNLSPEAATKVAQQGASRARKRRNLREAERVVKSAA